MFVPCINSIKTLFIIPTDAHNYKIIGMLKTVKIPTVTPTYFGSRRNRFLVGKPEGKRSLRRPRRRCEDNIKVDLQEVGGSCGYWMELAQDRDRWRVLVSRVRILRIPKMLANS